MGGCVSMPDRCMGRGGGRQSSPGATPREQRRKGSSSAAAISTFRAAEASSGLAMEHSAAYCSGNPALQASGSIEEAWYDSLTAVDSEEEEFHSIQNDAFSVCNSERDVRLSSSSFRDPISPSVQWSGLSISSDDQAHKGHKLSERAKGNLENNMKPFVSHDDVTVLDGEEGAGMMLDACGIIPGNCLPRRVVATSIVADRRKPLSSSPPNSATKAPMKLPFKRKSGEIHSISTLLSTKEFLERPLAGSQVPLCLLEKKMLDSWSQIEPNTFKVRGEHYFRDKKKGFAPNSAAYTPFGVDVYLCQQKINHISRFVELPALCSSGKIPPILVVNCQIPLYSASIFQNETDGEGISFVLYFRISESSRDLPSHFLENIRRLIDNDDERIKGFPMDTKVPFRERLKILGRIANMEDLPLSAAERKLMHAYNEKPVLSRPQHDFHSGENYFEIDLDMHRFSYISRKGFETFLDRLKLCILDFGLTIQGNKSEELPENILCCVRLNGVDYSNYFRLATHQPIPGDGSVICPLNKA